MTEASNLRVALLAGCLERHGAERQAVFMARALRQAGADVRIYSLTRGDHYEHVLSSEGFVVEWAGRFRNPLVRVGVLIQQMRRFKPHIVQATLGHNNLHAALVAKALRAVSIGALRTDLEKCGRLMGSWTPYLFSKPTGVIVNSKRGEQQLRASGWTAPDRVWLLPNVVDLAELGVEKGYDETPKPADSPVTAIFLSRLVGLKRLDLFLRALASARQSSPNLCGLVVGDGPERQPMEALARELELLPEGVRFHGESFRPAEQIRESDFLVLCSDHEGSPNSVLEAMAMGKPAIVTPAGDAPVIVEHGVSGFVVDFDNHEQLSERMVEMAQSPGLRAGMGRASRNEIERSYSLDGLARRLLEIYSKAGSAGRSPLPVPAGAIAE